MAKKHNCKECGKEYVKQNSTQKVCSYICALKYNEKKTEERFNKAKESVKTDKKFMAIRDLAKKVFQKYIRIRDKDLPCISCETTYSEEWHGGHLFKAELYSGVLLNELNVNKQCKKCNYFSDGNEVNYVKGFIKKYGYDKFVELSELATKTKNKKWTREELEEKINYYKQLI